MKNFFGDFGWYIGYVIVFLIIGAPTWGAIGFALLLNNWNNNDK